MDAQKNKKLKNFTIGQINKIVQNTNWRLKSTPLGEFYLKNLKTDKIIEMDNYVDLGEEEEHKYQLFSDEVLILKRYIRGAIVDDQYLFSKCYISVIRDEIPNEYSPNYRLMIVGYAHSRDNAFDLANILKYYSLSEPFDHAGQIYKLLKNAGVHFSSMEALEKTDFYCLDELFEKSF